MSSPAISATPARRRLPVWLWVALGFCLLALAALALTQLLLRDRGYTLEIVVSPPDSDVFVDEVRRGVTAVDGKIRVENLKGGPRMIRVSHEGYKDYNHTVTLGPRRVEPLVAQLVSTAAPAAPPAPVTPPREIDYGGAMVLVPAGDFVMGSNEYKDERPEHTVPVPAFYIDKYEVTNEQYLKYCEATKHAYPHAAHWESGYFRKRPLAPVVGVDWEDARDFCGAAYAGRPPKRLPNEAEWEKAASWDENAPQGKQKRRWPWGDEADQNRAVLSRGPCCPSEVGKNPGDVSAYGVQDMAGNVSEWVNDFYLGYQGNDCADCGFGEQWRVSRGCSFPCVGLDNARTTRRFYWLPRFTPSDIQEGGWVIGIRCAVSADDPRLQEYLRGR